MKMKKLILLSLTLGLTFPAAHVLAGGWMSRQADEEKPSLQLNDTDISVGNDNNNSNGKELSSKPSVSFIYYPSGGALKGHAELEVEGTSRIRINSKLVIMKVDRGLERMIQHSKEGNGLPFLRFIININPNQFQQLEKNLQHDEEPFSLNCAHGALKPLAQCEILSVPLPLNLSPLLSAVYLKLGHTLGLNNIQDIEFYGNDAWKKNVVKMAPGIVFELFSTVGPLLWIYIDPTSIRPSSWPITKILSRVYSHLSNQH